MQSRNLFKMLQFWCVFSSTCYQGRISILLVCMLTRHIFDEAVIPRTLHLYFHDKLAV